MPYAITAAVISAISYLAASLVNKFTGSLAASSIISLVIGVALLFFFLTYKKARMETA